MDSLFLKLVLGCTLFLVLGFSTFANSSYSISPVRSEFTLNPNTFSTGEVIIYNGSNESKNIEVYFEECIKSENGINCGSYPTGGTLENSPTFWVNFTEGKKYTLPSKSSKKISYSIAIPSSAKGGSYFGVIKASDVTSEYNDLNIKSILGSLLLITVNRDIESILDIGKPSILISPISIKFTIPIKNSGNIYLKPIGKIEIFDNNRILTHIGEKFVTTSDFVITGKEIVDFISLNSEGRSILPNEQSEFVGEWKGFAFNKIDQAQNITVDYQSPSEYFSNLEKKTKVLYPFFKLNSREKVKNLSVKITLYENVTISSGKDFTQVVPLAIKYQGTEIVPNLAMFFWLKYVLNFL